MLKKNGGITLIALVVTIIVLLILAGISIAMLTGNNGIITRTNDSKMKQIEGQVQEEIKLAVQSAKIYATQKSITTSSGWFASVNIDNRDAADISDDAENVRASTTADDVIGVLREDLTVAKGYSSITGSNTTLANAPTTTQKITVTYTTDAYKAATNSKTASIVGEISVKQNTIKLTKLTVVSEPNIVINESL